MELEKKIVRHKIQEIYSNDILSSYSYEEIENISDSKFIDYKQTIGLKISESNFFPILFLIFSSIFLSKLLYDKKEVINDNHIISFFYLINFCLLIYSLYSIFFKKKKTFLEVKENSFVINEKREIKWTDVLVTGKLIGGGKFTTYYLILGLSTLEILRIDMNGTKISINDFIKIIHLNQKKIKKTSL